MRRIARYLPIFVVSAAIQLIGADLWFQYSPTTDGLLGSLAQVYALLAMLLGVANVVLFYSCIDCEDPFQWVVIRHDLMFALFFIPTLLSYVLMVPGLWGRVIVEFWRGRRPSSESH